MRLLGEAVVGRIGEHLESLVQTLRAHGHEQAEEALSGGARRDEDEQTGEGELAEALDSLEIPGGG